MTDCLFCKIIDGDLPSDQVTSTERLVAFRDINPAAPVHVLIVPKQHVETIGEFKEADPGLLDEMFDTANQVAMKEGISGSGYRLLFNRGKDSGMLVPHLHLHLIGGAPLGPIAHAGPGKG